MTRPIGTQNKKTNTTWNDVLQDKYNALFNRYEKFSGKTNLNRDTYITDHKRNLLTFIENQPLGNSRKKDLLFMVGRKLAILNDRYFKTYLQAGFELQKVIAIAEKKNVQTDNEKQYFMTLDTLKYILKDEKFKDHLTNRDIHMQYLLLNILLFQPTMRPDFYISCKVITQLIMNDKINNFLLINARTKKMNFIINRDKISKAKNHLDNIEIENENLKVLIRQSLVTFPREFLFEDENDEPYSYFKISNALKKATGNKGIGFSMIRSAFVTDFYKKNESTYDREILSFKMRHSFFTALIHYNKIGIDKTGVDNTQECIDDKAKLKIMEVKQLVSDAKNEPTDQLFKIQRNNTLLKLNQRDSKPRQITIDKYNLVYDKKNKKWV